MGITSSFNLNPGLEKINKEILKNNKWYRSWWMNLIYGFFLGILASLFASIIFIKFIN